MNQNLLLATANAALIAVSTGCALAALRAIRRRDVPRHRRLMLAAAALQAAFLVLFVLRFVRYGPTPYRGQGAARVVYHVVLFSHEPLAVVSLPLVVATLVLGLTGRYRGHRELARMALPIWLYSSVTGLALYLFLYP